VTLPIGTTANDLHPYLRTLWYFTPVQEMGTKWDNIDVTIRTSIRH